MRRLLAMFAAAAVLGSAVALANAPPAPATAAGSESAVWAPKKVDFIYRSFTTYYSCDGLRQKMIEMLKKLGAQDLQVRSVNCTALVGPDQLPGVRISMNVLDLAGAVPGQRVPAHWRRVNLVDRVDPTDAAAYCDLIQQFKEQLLPLFTTRDIDYSAACARGKLLTAGTRLTVDVLFPDTSPAAAAR